MPFKLEMDWGSQGFMWGLWNLNQVQFHFMFHFIQATETQGHRLTFVSSLF